MNRFTIPRDIYFGRGALDTLKTLKGERAMIVTGGGSMQKFGFLEKVQQLLKEAGFDTYVYEGVESDPSVETVMRGAGAMRAFAPDWIVAVGGGSPIDAAKAMWAFYEYPDTSFDDLCVPFHFPTLRTRARFCAIPSTSGTATEVTAFSVITDYQNGVKYPLADYNITPDIAIVDPALAETMPPTLAAYTGMDAFTHAVEAYVSTLHNDFTDPLALHAIRLINDYLLPSYRGDGSARERMHNAQCLAGMAFSNALLGITHSMAHKTGAAFENGHVVHGCANAIFLPYVIRFNSDNGEASERYRAIARSLNLEPTVNALIDHIVSMNRALSIPACLKNYENGMIGEDEFLQKLPRIAKLAVADACTGSNPRTITEEQMEKLLRDCYYGE
ncbi:MAG: iron-containing alcohol dehydrogenase [Clostridia bacterium]|nr:iron-containing alcohol dehydrogenase [Clostridia bacterium]